MSEAARSRRPDVRFEPHLNRPAAVDSAAEDPLAELARLVGQDDPFRTTFRPSGSAKPQPQRLNSSYSRFAEQGAEEVASETPHAYGHDGLQHAPEHDLNLRPSSHDHGDWSETAHEQNLGSGSHENDYQPNQEYAAYDSAPLVDGRHDPQDYAAPPLTPDLWAERGDPAVQHGYAVEDQADETASSMRAPRRPLVVLAAVLVLTGGGLAATFLARSGIGPAAQARSAPTIMAAVGPNKIKLADASPDATPEDADSALLSKNGASSGGPAKVMNSQEQPIDLTQLPKAAASPETQTAPDAITTGSASPFPEPKKVKTFLVRPDGTMMPTAPSAAVSTTGSIPAPARPALPRLAMGSSGSETESSSAASAAPRPSTPKASTRTATTPKAPPTSIADLASASASDVANTPSKPKQAASPGANAQSKSKPIEVANAPAPDAATGSTGAFALQLAAAPSEQDARGIFSRLQKKYANELGSVKPTIRKAENGDKSIYRVRVGNLSQDQAKSLCAQLQASGGSCFVVHN